MVEAVAEEVDGQSQKNSNYYSLIVLLKGVADDSIKVDILGEVVEVSCLLAVDCVLAPICSCSPSPLPPSSSRQRRTEKLFLDLLLPWAHW